MSEGKIVLSDIEILWLNRCYKHFKKHNCNSLNSWWLRIEYEQEGEKIKTSQINYILSNVAKKGLLKKETNRKTTKFSLIENKQNLNMQHITSIQVRYEALLDGKVIHNAEKQIDYKDTLDKFHQMRKFAKEQSDKLFNDDVEFSDSALIVKAKFD